MVQEYCLELTSGQAFDKYSQGPLMSHFGLYFFFPIDSKREFSVLENFIQHYVNLEPVEPMVELVTLEQLWIQILIPPLSSIMILGTLLHLSEL